MRPIDADALHRKIHENPASNPGMRCAQLLDAILNAPTIDAVPVVHARWVAEYRAICSACKTQFDDDVFWIQGGFTAPKYCPNCGAKMDKED